MKKKITPSQTEKSTTWVDPPYLKAFNAKPSNEKVGQTFVTTFNKPLPKKKDS